MRFTEAMVGRRGAVVELVREGLLSQVDAAAELGLSARQVRRLVRRLAAAGGDVQALGYRRRHPAPNRLADQLQAATRAVADAHPRWSARATWEELEAQGLEALPSLRTISRWLGAWRGSAPVARPRPARRFEAARPLELAQMDTTSGLWLDGRRMAYVIVLLDDYSRAILAARAVGADSTWHNLQVLEEKVARDHTVSLDGVSYSLPREPNLVAFTVELRVRPGQTVRVWHADRLVAEPPHGGPAPQDGLSVDDLLRRILPQLEPKQPRAAGAPPPGSRSAARSASRGGRTSFEGRRQGLPFLPAERTF